VAYVIRHGIKPTKFLVRGTIIAGGLNLIADVKDTPPPGDDGEYKVIEKLFKIPLVHNGPFNAPIIG
jgi:hypothetical protein